MISPALRCAARDFADSPFRVWSAAEVVGCLGLSLGEAPAAEFWDIAAALPQPPVRARFCVFAFSPSETTHGPTSLGRPVDAAGDRPGGGRDPQSAAVWLHRIPGGRGG